MLLQSMSNILQIYSNETFRVECRSHRYDAKKVEICVADRNPSNRGLALARWLGPSRILG